jgi:hypothetical protein
MPAFPTQPSLGLTSAPEDPSESTEVTQPPEVPCQAPSVIESGAADNMNASLPTPPEKKINSGLVRFESTIIEESKVTELASANVLDFLGNQPDTQEQTQERQEESGIEFLNEYLNQAQ